MDEKQRHDQFVKMVGGVNRADRMMFLWNNSFPSGTSYDRLFNTGGYCSRENSFRLKAKCEGFNKKQIDMFLNL